jgi:hypothetical protein
LKLAGYKGDVDAWKVKEEVIRKLTRGERCEELHVDNAVFSHIFAAIEEWLHSD